MTEPDALPAPDAAAPEPAPEAAMHEPAPQAAGPDAATPDAATPDAAIPEAATPVYESVPDDALPQEQLAALEAILMVVDEPVPAAQLAGVLGLPTGQVLELLTELTADYAGERGGRARGFVLRELAGGWRIYSAPALADVVGRFVVDGQTARLTQASLETLAVIAYRQPVSRGRVAAIRGVNVDGVVRTLLARGLIEEAGHDDDGGAVLYRTSDYFLERMGLGSVADLPALAPYLPDLDGLDDLAEELR